MNVNVLVVEDNPDDALIVQRLLGREQGRYDVMVADNFTGARALLADVQFDVVLLDLGLPDVHENFIQTLVGEHPDTPFIVLTGDDNDKTAENALAQGAQDYLYKGRLDRALLVRSIGYAISHKRTESRLKTTLQELKDTQVELVQRERLSALGQMASGVAHDFNNAIAPILSQADYLLTFHEVRQDDRELRKSLAAIQQAAIDAGLVVGRLKTFYSPPNADIEIVPLDLALLARDTVSLTKPLWRDEALAEGKEITTTVTSEGNTWIRANAIEIKEALTNLIFNAVAAIPVRGAIEITVSGDAQSVSLGVSDDGEGMDSETLSRCFEPFYSTRGDVGTGLGLSLVKTTMQKNGSDVQLTSFPGVGTTFQFEFEATEPITGNLVSLSEPKVDTAEEAKRRIVIVEDELPIRRIIKMSLIQSPGDRCSQRS